LQRGLAFGGVTDEGTVVVIFGAIVDFYCHKAGLVVKTQSAVVGKIKVFVEEKKSAPVGRSFLPYFAVFTSLSGMAEMRARNALFTCSDDLNTFAISGSIITTRGSSFICDAKRLGFAFL
jgi:hypothetical protein